MRPQVDPRPPEERIAGLARKQEGVVATFQLRAAGFGERTIARRVEQGRWRRIHRGVYALGPSRLSRDGRWWAAVLACGEGAVLSHVSAAALWGVRPFGSSKTHVTVPSRSGRRPDRKILLHRVATLGPADVTWRRRIPVTTPARTLADLAGELPLRELERAFDEAEHLRLLKLRSLESLLLASLGRRGAANLRVVIASHQAGSTRTRTYLEERFFTACDRHAVPRPEVNIEIGGDTVDFLWRQASLVVETDGEASHRTRLAFEEDRARDVRLALLGYRVIRFTYRQVEDDPDAVAAAVKALL